MRRLADGLYRWTGRHPEWHPGEFGAEVASFAVLTRADTLLIDPLVVDAATAERLDAVVTGRVSILITIPYHARSAEALAERYRARIYGHAAVASRLRSSRRFRAIEPGSRLPAGVSAHAIGKPQRQETPFLIPSHGALAFGDAVVGVDGGLRVWVSRRLETERQRRWYRERLVPTLRPLLDLDADRVLVTHGGPVLRRGRRELERALDADGWHHRP